MARFTVNGLNQFSHRLSVLNRSGLQYEEKAINAALPYLENAVVDAFEKIPLSDRSTGALRESIVIVKAERRRNGFVGGVGFKGKDQNNVRNGLKAGVLEYGKLGQPARPFLRPAVANSKEEVITVMEGVFNRIITNGF